MDDDCLCNHASLSSTYREFVTFALAEQRPSHGAAYLEANMPAAARNYQYGIQPWPVIIDADKHQRLGEIALRLVGLAHSIPLRVFGNDQVAIRTCFGAGDGAGFMAAFEEPTGFDVAISRCDIVLTASGPKLLEFNLGSNIGGWQIYLLEETYRREPTLAGFVNALRRPLGCRNPLRILTQHFATIGSPYRMDAHDPVRVAITVRKEQFTPSQALVAHVNAALVRAGTPCQISCYTSESSIELTPDSLVIDGRPVQVVFNFNNMNETPDIVYCAFKQRLVAMVNSPACYALCNKKTVALLSEMAHDGKLNEVESELVDQYIPWTRHVTERLDFHGDSGDALAILLRYKERMVLKPLSGGHGIDVVVGHKASDDEWLLASRKACKEGRFVAQEYCPSLPYLAVRQNGVCVRHDFVWGVFTCANRFAGSWIRMLPADHADGVINSARGALEGIVFDA